MNYEDDVKNNRKLTENEFALAIANLTQKTDGDVSNKPGVSQTKKSRSNTFKAIDICQPGPSRSNPRSTPKKKDVLSDTPQLETPKKGSHSHRRKIFQTPTKIFDKEIGSLSSHKSPRRKASQQKRTMPKQGNSDDEGSSKKRCKVVPKEVKEKTDCSEEDKDACDIDEVLEFKAGQLKMNAKNVKTLLRQVLTNPSVLNMFKDVLEFENGDSPEKTPQKDAHHLEYEPMLTRAKVKDLLERVSVASPSKKPASGPSILDVDFAEEEEDDEYDPAKDEVPYSDEDDTESMLSSRFSDFGSPGPRTPNTPRPSQSHENKSAALTSSMGQDHLSEQTFTPPRLVISTIKDESSTIHENEGSVNNIALRTRSKLPLHSTSITDIENAFVAPDITPDMYYTNDDADWNQFLSTLYKQPEEAGTDDDGEANDPEFDYIAEAALEEEDAEEVQFNKPTKITKKELNALWDELNDLFGDEVLPYQAVSSLYDPHSLNPLPETNPKSAQDSVVSFKAPLVPESISKYSNQEVQVASSLVEMQTQPPLSDMQPEQSKIVERNLENQQRVLLGRDSIVTSFQIELIKDQMRKHVQLLAQSFVICDKPEKDSHQPEFLLRELKHYSEKSVAGEDSVYNVCNLKPALDFVNNLDKEDESALPQGWAVQGRAYFQVSTAQKLAMYKSPAFVYPHLLPTFKSGKVSNRQRPFLPSEDNLIALGLEQFSGCKGVRVTQLIQKHLVPREKENTIIHRIRYLSNQKAQENVVQFVSKNGRLPDYFPKSAVNEFVALAPQHQNHSLLPFWCTVLKRSRIKDQEEKGSTLSNLYSSTYSRADTNSENEEFQSTPYAEKLEEDEITPSSSFLPATSTPNLPPKSKNKQGHLFDFSAASSSSLLVKQEGHPLEDANGTLKTYQTGLNLIKPDLPEGSQTAAAVSSVHLNSQVRGATRAEQETPIKRVMKTDNLEAPSPDILAKTLISCGIGEDISNLSPIPSESFVSSPTSAKYGIIDSTVRNLGNAFDASENTRICKSQDSVRSKGSMNSIVKSKSKPGKRKVKKETMDAAKNISNHSPEKSYSLRSISLSVDTSENLSMEKIKKKVSSSQTISLLSIKNLDSLLQLGRPKINISEAENTVSSLASKTALAVNVGNQSENNNCSQAGVKESFAVNSGTIKAEAFLFSRKDWRVKKNYGDKSSNSLLSSKMVGHGNALSCKSASLLPDKDDDKNNFRDEREDNEKISMDLRHNRDVDHSNALSCKSASSLPDKDDDKNNYRDEREGNEKISMDLRHNRESKNINLVPSEDYNGKDMVNDKEGNSRDVPYDKERSDMGEATEDAKGIHEEKDNVSYAGDDEGNNDINLDHDERDKNANVAQDETSNNLNITYDVENKDMDKTKDREDRSYDREDNEDTLVNDEENSANLPANEEVNDANLADCKEKNFTSSTDDEDKDCLNIFNDYKKIVLSNDKGKSPEKPLIVKAKEKSAAETSIETDHYEDYVSSPNMSSGRSEVDQEEVDEIMADIVTFRYDPKDPIHNKKNFADSSQIDAREYVPDTKAGKEKEGCADFIAAYFQRVKDLLHTKFQSFERLLFLLSHLNIGHQNPFELYLSLTLMLHNHKDLVEDFGGVLLLFQAVLCGCIMSSEEQGQLEKCFSDIQSNYDASISVETLSRWHHLTKEGQMDKDFLREKLVALFQSSPGLLDKCCLFFLSQQSLKCQLSCIQTKDICQDAKFERNATEEKMSKRRRKDPDRNGEKNADSKQDTQTVMDASSEQTIYNSQSSGLTSAREGKVEYERTKAVTGAQPVIKIKEDIVDEMDSKRMPTEGAKSSVKSRAKQTSNLGTDTITDTQTYLESIPKVLKNSTKTLRNSCDGQQEVEVSQPSLPFSSLSPTLNQGASVAKSKVKGKTPSMPIVLNASFSQKAAGTHNHDLQTTPKSTKNSRIGEGSQPNQSEHSSPNTSLSFGSLQDPSESTQNSKDSFISKSLSAIRAGCSSLKLDKGSLSDVHTTCPTINGNVDSKPALKAQSLPQPYMIRTPQLSGTPQPVTASLPVSRTPFQPNSSSIVISPLQIPVLFYLQPQKLPNPPTTNELTVSKDSSQKAINILSRKPNKTNTDCTPRKTQGHSANKVEKNKLKSAKTRPRKAKPSSEPSKSLSKPVQTFSEGTEDKAAPLVYSQIGNKKAEANVCANKDAPTASSENQVKPSSNKTKADTPIQSNVKIPINSFKSSTIQTADGNKKNTFAEERLLQQTSRTDIDSETRNNTNQSERILDPGVSPSKSKIYNSPVKMAQSEMPAVVQNYLDTMSRGGLEESMDPQFLQHIAHLLVSPNKNTMDSRSKFDLLAFIESSQFAHKDFVTSCGFSRAASQFFNKTTSSVSGPIGFSEALKEYGINKSPCKEQEKGGDAFCINNEGNLDIKDKTDNSINVDHPELSRGQENKGSKLKQEAKSDVIVKDCFENQGVYPPEDLSPSVWTMEWDEKILEAVMENEGVSESIIEKLQLQIPMKSITELTSRAHELIAIMQQDIENEESQEYNE